MALYVWQQSITDSTGLIQPNASITVQDADTGLLVQLYEDYDGSIPLGNPFNADADGFAQFYTGTGRYHITAELGADEREWNDVRLGTEFIEIVIEHDAAETAAGVTATNYNYPQGHFFRYGGAGDDLTNNAAAFTAALGQMVEPGGSEVFIPPGIYRTNAALTNSDHATLRLRGQDWATTKIKFTAAVNGLVCSAQHAKVEGIWFDGNSTGLTGLVQHNSFLSVFQNCSWSGWLADGCRINETFTTPTGNCNNVRHYNCNFFSNTGKGVSCPTIGSDMNAIEFHTCYFAGNSSHGLLIKGQAWRVVGGNFEGNTGYGIQIGEDGDSVVSTKSVIEFPYLESNAAGAGVRGSGKSTGNLILIDHLNVNSGYSGHAAAENFAIWPHSTSGGMLSMGDEAQKLSIYNVTIGSARVQLVAEGTNSNVPLWLYSKGTDPIILNPNGGGPGVIIGAATTTLNAKTLLQLDSTTRGFLTPRMTSTERDAISSPPEGLEIFNTTTHKKNFYNGTTWEVVTSA